MEEFEIAVNGLVFTVNVVDQEKGLYLIFAGDVEYACIQFNENEEWINVNPFNYLPEASQYDEQINAIGNQIDSYYYYKDEQECADE